MLLENSHEVVGMLFANVLDAKIVNAEGEDDRTPLMCPKIWCDLALFVALLVK